MTANRQHIRTFIALPLPSDWIDALVSVVEQLKAQVPAGVRWVDVGGVHLTLRFLGNTDPDLAPRIVDGLSRKLTPAPAPTLSLSGLGTFPPRREPRVIWAGVAGNLDPLLEMYRRTELLVESLGWPPERRPFRPHLTLGRVRDRSHEVQRQQVLDAVATTPVPATSLWTPDIVRLYQSVLTPGGAIYTSLGDVPLVGTN